MTTTALLNANPIIFILICGLYGLLVGSFLNVVIYRLPIMFARSGSGQTEPTATYNLAVPRSACPSCNRSIGALENIPLLSYAILRGKCAGCATYISLRYPMVELLTGLLFACAAWRFGFEWVTAGIAIFLAAMVTLSFIDFDTRLLPDSITLPLLWAGLLFNVIVAYIPVGDAVIGAVAGYILPWSFYWLFKLATGKEGMGYGDFKLLAAIGAWLGWQAIPLILLLASIASAAIGVLLIFFSSHKRSSTMPLGPFLAASATVALFLGAQFFIR